MKRNEIIAAWNAQADDSNSWIHLGEDEKLEWAIKLEREAIYSEWHSCVMSDLENGVKWLNERAAAEWHKNYPAQSKLFPAWIEARGQA